MRSCLRPRAQAAKDAGLAKKRSSPRISAPQSRAVLLAVHGLGGRLRNMLLGVKGVEPVHKDAVRAASFQGQLPLDRRQGPELVNVDVGHAPALQQRLPRAEPLIGREEAASLQARAMGMLGDRRAIQIAHHDSCERGLAEPKRRFDRYL